MHGGNELPPVMMFPLIMKRMITIGEGQEPRQVRLSPTMKSTLINIYTGAHLVKAWEMTP